MAGSSILDSMHNVSKSQLNANAEGKGLPPTAATAGLHTRQGTKLLRFMGPLAAISPELGDVAAVPQSVIATQRAGLSTSTTPRTVTSTDDPNANPVGSEEGRMTGDETSERGTQQTVVSPRSNEAGGSAAASATSRPNSQSRLPVGTHPRLGRASPNALTTTPQGGGGPIHTATAQFARRGLSRSLTQPLPSLTETPLPMDYPVPYDELYREQRIAMEQKAIHTINYNQVKELYLQQKEFVGVAFDAMVEGDFLRKLSLTSASKVDIPLVEARRMRLQRDEVPVMYVRHKSSGASDCTAV